MGFVKSLFGGAFAIAMLPLYFVLPLGWLYWLWLAIQFGNFWMFVVGVIPPTAILTAPIGAWSLLFGVPQWVLNWFLL